MTHYGQQQWGLWSLARKSWHPDPMIDDGTPLMFENVMDAITAAASYSSAFRLVPVRFNHWGEPWTSDLAAVEDD